MTYLYNNPSAFADDAIAGLVAAHRSLLRLVPGGVVRATAVPEGQVAVVVGGGSGHYPAFGGLVGQGLAHGAALGNVFASPSAQQIYEVARAVDRGAGVLFCYGNYMGDVLNFDQAEARLTAEGVPCRAVAVTDDVSSAPPERREQRRGIAGDLAVFKAAAFAAEAGATLDEAWELARRANDRTRTLGAAFTGCTLPGAKEPLFTVPPGRMGLGIGIHGEPGLGEEPTPSADALAEILVSHLLAELPPGIETPAGQRVALVLNGLGAIKHEELFVLYRRVEELLSAAAVNIVEPEVGELVTSFEMAGTSLTLCWLDDQLERAWRAPAYTPAHRKGASLPVTIDQPHVSDRRDVYPPAATPAAPAPSAESRSAATEVVRVLAAVVTTLNAHVDELGRLDAVAGDGDHGIGMQRGASAALDAARAARDADAGVHTVLIRASEAWSNRAGGTSGALWGVVLRSIASAHDDLIAPTLESVRRGVAAAAEGVARYGGARLGDKTMLDVLVPFAEALGSDRGTESLPQVWAHASRAADVAANATAALIPRIGRARPHAERSIGVADPGAVSTALVVRTVSEALNQTGE